MRLLSISSLPEADRLIPYYGETKEGEEEFIIRSVARDGTNTFFPACADRAYASIYKKRGRGFTLALRPVRRSEGVLGASRDGS